MGRAGSACCVFRWLACRPPARPPHVATSSVRPTTDRPSHHPALLAIAGFTISYSCADRRADATPTATSTFIKALTSDEHAGHEKKERGRRHTHQCRSCCIRTAAAQHQPKQNSDDDLLNCGLSSRFRQQQWPLRSRSSIYRSATAAPHPYAHTGCAVSCRPSVEPAPFARGGG